MEVECTAFLHSIGRQERGIQIQEQTLRFLNGVDPLPQPGIDPVELIKRVIIHSVEEP